MGKFVLKDCRLFVAAFNLSGFSNVITLDHSAEEKDVTDFDSGGAVERLAGLENVAFSGAGHNDYAGDSVDEYLFGRISGGRGPVTIGPEGKAIGNPAYLFEGETFSYSQLGQVGEVAPYEISGAGSSPLVSGKLLEVGATAKTVTGNTTAVEVGAVSASQKLYAALHVLEVSGTNPTLDAVLQSDVDANFNTPATQHTFTQATAVGSQWMTPVAGAITDTFYRLALTIGGTDNPSFLIAASIGIKAA